MLSLEYHAQWVTCDIRYCTHREGMMHRIKITFPHVHEPLSGLDSPPWNHHKSSAHISPVLHGQGLPHSATNIVLFLLGWYLHVYTHLHGPGAVHVHKHVLIRGLRKYIHVYMYCYISGYDCQSRDSDNIHMTYMYMYTCLAYLIWHIVLFLLR